MLSLIKNPVASVLLVLVLAVSGVLLAGSCSRTTSPPSDRAAIVDQLEPYEPNAELISKITTLLENSGLTVDYYHGEEITVDLYRDLPSRGYKLILFRSHAGLLGSGEEAIQRTCLFTGEDYSSGKYIGEQLTDQLAMARINETYPWVFAIGSSFVERSMRGQYPNTVLLMMGCSTLHITDLAEAMVKKGASACTGFDASIGAEYMDDVILSLIRKLCRDKLSLSKSVNGTIMEHGGDPYFGGSLKYYPEDRENMTLAELTSIVPGN
ncbi:MAG: hypothetical protein JXA46_10425 [Dehalococcoidales bacterium]|nr:hypothetical protein [Dehalococcoidales bacterium]